MYAPRNVLVFPTFSLSLRLLYHDPSACQNTIHRSPASRVEERYIQSRTVTNQTKHRISSPVPPKVKNPLHKTHIYVRSMYLGTKVPQSSFPSEETEGEGGESAVADVAGDASLSFVFPSPHQSISTCPVVCRAFANLLSFPPAQHLYLVCTSSHDRLY